MHPVLSGRRLLDPLETEVGTVILTTRTNSPGATTFTVPSTTCAHQAARRSGSTESKVIISTAMLFAVMAAG